MKRLKPSKFSQSGITMPIAIVIAAVLVSFALILVSVQMPGSAMHRDSDEMSQLIRDEIHRSMDEARKDGPAQPIVDETVLAEKIEQGINQYIAKQQEAQRKAQEAQKVALESKSKDIRKVDTKRDHIFGNPNAPISIVEYSDFECPYCKRFHPTPKELVAKYQGKVNWVYRHYPLEFHNPLAQKEAEATECANALAGNEAFWKYADLIMENTKSNGKGLMLSQLNEFADQLGIDAAKFSECLKSGQFEKRVQEDIAEGSRIGVSGTPANFIVHNKTGEVVVKSGAQPVAAFSPIIEKMLNQPQGE